MPPGVFTVCDGRGAKEVTASVMDTAWMIRESELEALVPHEGRELLVECFFRAQCEAENWCKSRVRTEIGEREMRATVTEAIRLTFIDLGLDWEFPSREALCRAADALVLQAEAWGIESTVLEDHIARMRMIRAAMEA